MTKKKLGVVSNATLITITLAIIGWLAIQVYTNINSRLVDVEGVSQSDHTNIASMQSDISWIRAALQAKGFNAPNK